METSTKLRVNGECNEKLTVLVLYKSRLGATKRAACIPKAGKQKMNR
jgi:hypothetical protein